MANSLYGYEFDVLKNIFPDFDTFKAKLITSPLFSDADGEWTGCNETTYQLIYNRYQGSHLNMSEESFIGKFSNILFEHFEKFEYDIAIKQYARTVSDNDWSVDGKSINNMADSPNTIGGTDDTSLNSLDRQTKVIVEGGVSRVIYKKSDHNKAYYIKGFCDKFKGLFIKFLDPIYTPVWVSNADGDLEEI